MKLKTAKEMARRSLKPEWDECEFNAAVDKAQSTMECLKPSPAILKILGKSEKKWHEYIAKFDSYKEKAAGCVVEEYHSYYMPHVRQHVQQAQDYGVDLESTKEPFAYLNLVCQPK